MTSTAPPLEGSTTASPWVPLWRIIEQIASAIGDSRESEHYARTRLWIRQAAHDERLRIRGKHEIEIAGQDRTNFSDVYTDIPSAYWKHSVINVLATGASFEAERHTDPEKTVHAWGPKGLYETNCYTGLQLNSDDVSQLIGEVTRADFSSDAPMSQNEEWINAASALALLGMKHLPGTLAICKRADAGLIRARAVRFVDDGRSADNADVPAKFWWAKGEAALTQDWATGDFETWIDHRKHLQAFGVSFLRADIEKMVPSGLAKQSSAPNAPVVAKNSRSAIILTALDVETRATLRHLTDVQERTVRGGTVFHVGQYGQWVVAVAECGEGNVHAAATTERGITHFHPEVAMFVGVAGGVKDVTIGDAVVSSKVYGYERGKDAGNGFKPRPTVNLPDYALEQRARAVRLKDDWQRRLNPELQHSKPQIYIGAIAAGEKVVASSASKIAQFLKDHYGDTLAVEMEGQGFLAGVHINTPVQGCVIRGISDLLDGKGDADNAGSQVRAADVASAVAFEMLATLDPDQAPTSESNPTELKPPLTMRQIFDSDFPGVGKIFTRIKIDNLFRTGQSEVVPVNFYYQAEGNSFFLSFFILSSPNALLVCKAIADRIDNIVSTIRQDTKIILKDAGSTGAIYTDTMQFTKQIYIYTEEDLSLSDLAELERLFKTNGMTVSFRGFAYRVIHWNEHDRYIRGVNAPENNSDVR